MHRKPAGFIVVIIFAIACHSSQPQKEPSGYFPVAAFLKEQVHLVDSLQLPVTKFSIAHNKTDSVLLSAAEFKNLAARFITPDISDSALSKNYAEKKFRGSNNSEYHVNLFNQPYGASPAKTRYNHSS